MPHLYADISSHGLGHLAQTAPVLNELRRRLPNLRLTVRSGLPRAALASRIGGMFEHLQQPSDFGMLMANAVDVLTEQSAHAYAEFHRDWEPRVAREAALLAQLAPDAVLADVSYLALAGAGAAGIPAVAMCCLNWADIYRHYCGGHADAGAIERHMLDAYNSACCFLKVQPTMPMAGLKNAQEIGTIAQGGENRRDRINTLLGLERSEKLVLVAMGGIHMRLPMEDWPRIPGVRWLVQASWQVRHPDAIELERLGLPFIDVLHSCDALLTKPGYGSFAEAAVNGTPVLYLRRQDWPEEPYLIDWLKRHGACLEVERQRLMRGDVADELQALLALPAARPPLANGATQAADVLAQMLRGSD